MYITAVIKKKNLFKLSFGEGLLLWCYLNWSFPWSDKVSTKGSIRPILNLLWMLNKDLFSVWKSGVVLLKIITQMRSCNSNSFLVQLTSSPTFAISRPKVGFHLLKKALYLERFLTGCSQHHTSTPPLVSQVISLDEFFYLTVGQIQISFVWLSQVVQCC